VTNFYKENTFHYFQPADNKIWASEGGKKVVVAAAAVKAVVLVAAGNN
jgi:hypothetical protein